MPKPSARAAALGRSALCGALALMAAALSQGGAQALPVGGVAAGNSTGAPAGNPTITNPSASELQVQLNAPRTIIDWRSFDIAPGEAARFLFSDRNGIVLNRSLGGAAVVNGVLQGLVGTQYGGNVWIASPQGVVFGPNARVDVGGLLATSGGLFIPDSSGPDPFDFLNPSNLSFRFSNAGAPVSVQAGARITGYGGTLAFIAPTVTTAAGATVEGAAARLADTAVLYGASDFYTVTFQQEADNDLDLFDFVVPAGYGSGSAAPLTLGAATNAGSVYVAAVTQSSVVNALISAPGLITATRASNEGGDVVLSAGGGIAGRTAAAATAGGAAVALTTGAITAGRDIYGRGGGPATTGALQAGQSIDLALTQGQLTVASATAGADVSASTAFGDATLGVVTAGRNATLNAAGALTLSTVTATGGTARLSGGSLSTSTLTAGQDVIASAASGALTVTTATAGDDLRLSAAQGVTSTPTGGGLTVGTARTTGVGADAEGDGAVLALSGRTPSIGTADGAGDVLLTATSGDLLVTNARAGDDLIARADAGTLRVRSATLTGSGADVDGDGAAGLDAAGDGRRVSLTARGGTGDVILGADTPDTIEPAYALTGASDVQVVADRDAVVNLPGAVTLSRLEGGRNVQAQAATLAAGAVTAGQDASLRATGALTATTASAGRDLALNAGSLSLLRGTAGRDLSLGASAGGISVGGPLAAGRTLNATASGAVALGAVTAGDDLYVRAGLGEASVGAATVGDDAFVLASNGTVRLGSLTLTGVGGDGDADGAETLDAFGNGRRLLLQGGGATGDALLGQGAGSVSGGTDLRVVAGRDAVVDVQGAARLTAVTGGRDAAVRAGSVDLTTLTAGQDAAASASTGGVTIGTAGARRDLALTAPNGTVSAGAASATRDLLLAGQAVQLGSAPSSVGRDLTIRAAAEGLTAGGPLTAGRSVTVEVGGALALTDVIGTTGTVRLTGASLSAGTLTAGQDVIASALSGSLTVTTATAGDDLRLSAAGGTTGTPTSPAGVLTVGTARTTGLGADAEGDGAVLALTGRSPALTTVDGAGDVLLTATSGDLLVTSVRAGDDLIVRADAGAARVRAATLTGTGADVDADGAAGPDAAGDGRRLLLTARGAAGDAVLGGDTPGAILPAYTLTGASDVQVIAERDAAVNLPGAQTLARVEGGRDVQVQIGGPSTIGTVVAGQDARVLVADAPVRAVLNITGASAGRDLTLDSQGFTSIVRATSGRNLSASAPGQVVLGTGVAGQNLTLSSATVRGGSLSAGADLNVSGFTAVTFDSVAAGDDAAITGGRVAIGAARATGALDSEGDGQNIRASGAGVQIGAAVANTDVRAVATSGELQLGSTTAGRDVVGTASAGPVTVTGPVTAARGVALTATGGALTTAAVTATGGDAVLVGQSVATGAVRAGQAVALNATGGSATASGPLTAGGGATVLASGAIALGDVTAGGGVLLNGAGVTAGAVRGSAVTVSTSAAATLASVTASEDVFVRGTGTGDLSVGAAQAGDDIYVVAGNGSARLGGAALTGAGADLDGDGSTGTLDAAGNGRVLRIQGGGAAGDAVLGTGTGTLTGGTDLRMNGRDTIVNLTGSAQLTSVTATRNADLRAGALTVNSIFAGQDVTANATLGAVNVGTSLQAVGDASVTASGGDVTVGRLTVGDDLVVNASGTLRVNETATADEARLAVGDLALGGSLTARTVTVEARGGAARLGDAATTGGLVIDNAEFGRIRASERFSLYAGATDGTARGTLTVGDLTVDPARTPLVQLLAGPANDVVVAGVAAPTVTGGVLTIGEGAGAAWRPRSILVNGGLGAATIGESGSVSGARSFADVRLTAGGDILMGSSRFIGLVAGRSPLEIDIARGRPDGVEPQGTEANRVFVASQRLSLRADGRIVQQDTAPGAGLGTGLVLSNAPEGSRVVDVLSIGGTSAATRPSVIDLFGTLIDRNGAVFTGEAAAVSSAIRLLDGTSRGLSYRFNGCLIGGGACLSSGFDLDAVPTATTLRPDEVLESLQLEDNPEEQEERQSDPVITGAGNEEIWRERP